MKNLVLFIVSLIITGNVLAQDIHFSQFNNAPLSLNPALAGAFNAEHRVIANYKSQWHSVAKSFMTYGISYDAGLFKGKLNGGILGIGVQLFNDQAGENKLGLTQANVSIAYHLPVNRTNFITAGIQGGFAQRRIDETKMRWDSQYDPFSSDGYNASFSTGEPSTLSSKNYADFSAGLLWAYNSQASTMSSSDAKKVNVGISVSHLNRPRQSFYDVKGNKIYMKFAFHANSFIGIKNTNLAILPSAVWYRQGPFNDILVGSLFRYRLNNASKYTNFASENAIAIGCHYRVGDAVIVSAQLEYKNFLLGVSYDVNTSKLTSATNGAGGIEIAVSYITPLFDKTSKKMF